VFCRNVGKLGHGVIIALGTMVFMSFDRNRFGFQRMNDKIKDG
jgi:hypothetical protein